MNIIQTIIICVFIFLLMLLYIMQRRNVSFNKRVLFAFITGIALSFCVRFFTVPVAHPHISSSLFHFVGSAYISLLKMLVIPLVFTSIIYAIVKLGKTSINTFKTIVTGTVLMLLIMTSISSMIGMGVGILFDVGKGLQFGITHVHPHHYTGVIDTLLGFLPSNPISAMASGNTIALVVFSVFIGLSMLLLQQVKPDQSHHFYNFIESAFHVSKKLAVIVIGLTPYGVLGLMSYTGWYNLIGLIQFVAAMYLAMLLVLTMHFLILFSTGYLPWRYIRSAYPALIVAFLTRSSFGTLPVTEEVLANRFKVQQAIATFTPSMGATMGMNACAGIFPAMLVVMAMHITNQPITMTTIILVAGINAIASLGISGIPGTAFIAASVTLTTLGLPYAVVGLVQGVDPLIDMGRTATNVNGVNTTALTVNKVLYLENGH